MYGQAGAFPGHPGGSAGLPTAGAGGVVGKIAAMAAEYIDSPLQPLHPHSDATPKLDLQISCTKLRDRDTIGKSDPFVRVLSRFTGDTKWRRVGETEVKENEHNPDFVNRVSIPYFFAERQEVRFEVIDHDKGRSLPTHKSGESLGLFETPIASIVGCGSNWIQGSLEKGKGAQIRVVAEDHQRNKDAFEFHFQGIKLKSRDGPFSKSDAYLKFSSVDHTGRVIIAAQTEYVSDDKNPTWKPLTVSVNRMCKGDFNGIIQVDCFDFDDHSKDDLIGSFKTTLNELLSPAGFSKELEVPKKYGKSQGTIRLAKAPVPTQLYSFTDFLGGGLELDLMVAIDFTASNGSPQNPSSLHYNSHNPAHQNPYEIAIRAVGSVLAPYDSTRTFACFGFGGQLPGQHQVNHCFALNGNEANPMVHDVNGILSAYNTGLQNVRLSGPTYFAPVVRRAAQTAMKNSSHAKLKYTVLLLITDGAILDMQQTKAAISAAAKDAPLSIVIVGVGADDFAAMHVLDGDHSKRLFSRDIVQFVEMRSYTGASSGPRLAADTLAEIPGQVVSYYLKRSAKPLAAAAVATKILS